MRTHNKTFWKCKYHCSKLHVQISSYCSVTHMRLIQLVNHVRNYTLVPSCHVTLVTRKLLFESWHMLKNKQKKRVILNFNENKMCLQWKKSKKKSLQSQSMKLIFCIHSRAVCINLGSFKKYWNLNLSLQWFYWVRIPPRWC